MFVWCIYEFQFLLRLILARPRRCSMLHSWPLGPFGSLSCLQSSGDYWLLWLRTSSDFQWCQRQSRFATALLLWLQDKSSPALRPTTQDWILQQRLTATEKVTFQRNTAPWPDHNVLYLACLPRSGKSLDATFSIKVTMYRCVCCNFFLFSQLLLVFMRLLIVWLSFSLSLSLSLLFAYVTSFCYCFSSSQFIV